VNAEIEKMVSAHKEELRRERERVEVLLREQISSEIRTEISEKMESEYKA
jgi:hypothetical protein